MSLVDYWAKEGKGEKALEAFSWDSDHYSYEIQELIKQDGLILDSRTMTNQMRVVQS